MTAANTNALNLLGKEVSFTYKKDNFITDRSFVTYTENFSGVVTNVVLSLNSSPEISVNDVDFYSLDEIFDLTEKS